MVNETMATQMGMFRLQQRGTALCHPSVLLFSPCAEGEKRSDGVVHSMQAIWSQDMCQYNTMHNIKSRSILILRARNVR